MDVAKIEWSTRRVRLLAGPRVSNRSKVLSPDRNPPGPLASLETERSEHSAWRFATGGAPSVVTPLAAHASRVPGGRGGQQQIDHLALYFQRIRRAEMVMPRQMEWAWSACLQGTELKRQNGARVGQPDCQIRRGHQDRSRRGTTLADRPLSMTTTSAI